MVQLFAWDDGKYLISTTDRAHHHLVETDSVEFSTLSSNPELSQEFNRLTRDYVRDCLACRSEGPHMALSNPLVHSFGTVGEAVMRSCSVGMPSR